MGLIVVITAREKSARIPYKPYLKIDDVFLVETIADAAKQYFPEAKVVLTSESVDFLERFERLDLYRMKTDADIFSGTERVAQVSRSMQDDYYLLLPCDIWLKDWSLMRTFSASCYDRGCDCATLAKSVSRSIDLRDTGKVKALVDDADYALFFARSLDGPFEKYGRYLVQQLGMYFYSREALSFFLAAEKTTYEVVENNESFRFLLRGRRMLCVRTEGAVHSLNTYDDLVQLGAEENVEIKNGYQS